MTHSIIPELYKEAKNKLLSELSSVNHVALTSDCWTSLTMDGYISVTVHYINDKFKMVSRVLATRGLEVNTSAQNLASVLKDIVEEWGLTGEIAIEIEFFNEKRLTFCF